MRTVRKRRVLAAAAGASLLLAMAVPVSAIAEVAPAADGQLSAVAADEEAKPAAAQDAAGDAETAAVQDAAGDAATLGGDANAVAEEPLADGAEAAEDQVAAEEPGVSDKAGEEVVSDQPAAGDLSDSAEKVAGGEGEANTPEAPAVPEEPEAPEAPETPEFGWNADKSRWYENGEVSVSHAFYDPDSQAWYWADADGTIARNKEVYIPVDEGDANLGGKWVRFDAERRMIKGEYYDAARDAWYYFDPVSGAMAKGVTLISGNDGRKWVYYDMTTGIMAHGEQYIDYDAEHTGWYHFDENTGAMTYGFLYLPGAKKWVYYDKFTGKMLYGERCIDGGWYYLTPGTGAVDYEWAYIPGKNKWVYYDKVTGRMVYGGQLINNRPYYFDPSTGARWSKSQIVNKLIRTTRSYFGKHPDCPAALKAEGGLLCPYGPCMSFVWYSFHQAGLDVFLCNGAKTGWPHHNFDWYRVRGRVDMKPQVGDLAFFKFPTSTWSNPYSASHAAIVVRVDSTGVWVGDAIGNGIGEHLSYSAIQGYAHPYYN